MVKTLSGDLLQKVARYKLPERAVELLKKHEPLIITGATASGKNSVMKHLEQAGKWRHVITHTTRKPRQGEHSGKNYWFVSEEEMLRLLNSEALIEANVVHEDTVYGASIVAYEKVLNDSKHPVLVIDVQGFNDLIKQVPELRAMFLLPPSFEIWLERLNKRGNMSTVERHRRFRSAKQEISLAIKEPRFTFVINDDIASVSKEIVSDMRDTFSQKRAHQLAEQLLQQLQTY